MLLEIAYLHVESEHVVDSDRHRTSDIAVFTMRATCIIFVEMFWMSRRVQLHPLNDLDDLLLFAMF